MTTIESEFTAFVREQSEGESTPDAIVDAFAAFTGRRFMTARVKERLITRLSAAGYCKSGKAIVKPAGAFPAVSILS